MLSKVTAYLKGSYQELRKVTWPSRSKLLRTTGVVVIGVAIGTAVLGLIDAALIRLLGLIIA